MTTYSAELKMPEESQRENNHKNHKGSRWHKFHFSGKVIIGSVFLGLGLILIGGLVFAIGEDNEVDPKQENYPEELPAKAPITIVGPVVMGIGGTIVFIGIIMCLFETEVCRKRSDDSNPLIRGEQTYSGGKSSEAVTVPSLSRNHDKRCQKGHKKSPSPRRTKAATKKSHSNKEKIQSKSLSSRSPPVPIQSSQNFLTSSEDKFLTPPNSVAKESMALRSNARDAENQTSTSLMKSFTSSGPSWTTSTEFQTPATSFKDTSSSEASAQTDDLMSSSSTINSKKDEAFKNIEEGFLTPLIPTEEKIRQMRENIQRSNLCVNAPELHRKTYEKPATMETQNLKTIDKPPDDQSFDHNNIKPSLRTSQLKSQSLNSGSKVQEDIVNSSSNQESVSSEITYLNIDNENQCINSDVENTSDVERKYKKGIDGLNTDRILTENLMSPSVKEESISSLPEVDGKATTQSFLTQCDTETAYKSDDSISSPIKLHTNLKNSSSNEIREKEYQKQAHAEYHKTEASASESSSESKTNTFTNELHTENTSDQDKAINYAQKREVHDAPFMQTAEPTSKIESLLTREIVDAHENCEVEATSAQAEIGSITENPINESSNIQDKQNFEEGLSLKSQAVIQEKRLVDSS